MLLTTSQSASQACKAATADLSPHRCDQDLRQGELAEYLANIAIALADGGLYDWAVTRSIGILDTSLHGRKRQLVRSFARPR
jgi:hypothetical protein